MSVTKIGILGSGNIGTDLLIKAMRSPSLEVAALAGIDPDSDGLARAGRLGVHTTAGGVAGLLDAPDFDQVGIVLDATSAKAHQHHAAVLEPLGRTVIDLTPAAIGPYVVPSVNLDDHLDAANINMVTCGGQATIPVVHAINRVSPVLYAEIVASIASRSAGPGTRANIDEFTETTSRAIEVVGGARRGKAVVILNPADPPVLMRDTVLCLVARPDVAAIIDSVQRIVNETASYVPGYRLKQRVRVDPLPGDEPLLTLIDNPVPNDIHKVSVFLEVEGAAHYLPAFAGNLDIMTSAAVRTAERVAARRDALSAVGGAR